LIQRQLFQQEATMNSDQMSGKWKQLKGAAKERWGKLTDDDLDVINGQSDQLIGKIQERYGIAREVAQKQVDEWNSAQKRAADLRDNLDQDLDRDEDLPRRKAS
jgi:uncharacterized protein YjbJ (UPF0337 family)